MGPMTQYLQASTEEHTSNPAQPIVRRSDLTSDVQSLPPFVALDDLDKAVTVLDEWVSNFIGRMQPYCGTSMMLSGEKSEPSPEPDHSGLESRIYLMSRRVGQIYRALDEMNQSLHL